MLLQLKKTQYEKRYQPPDCPLSSLILSHKKSALFPRLSRQVKISFVLALSAFGLGILMPPLQAHASVPFKSSKKKDNSSEDIWKQIAKDFTLSEYEDTPEVQKQIRWYQQHSRSLTEITERAAPYLYYIHQQVREKGLPGELVLLPIIESAYNPFAYSQGASGLWQLMPQTGSRLGIKQNAAFDGRRDVVSSTQAALNYLGYLDTVFNDNWLLAIAAYNSGPGTVLNADKANKGDHGDTEFWSLHLPATTKQYVPRLLAIAAIISNPEKYGVHLPDVPNEPYFAKVDVDGPIALSKVAKLSDMPVNDIYNLNAGYKQKQVASNTPTHLLIPVEKIQTFKQNMDAQGKTVAVQMPTLAATEANTDSVSNNNTTVSYKVEAGDTLSKIAAHNHVKLNDLLKWNSLSLNSVVHTGQLLQLNTSESSEAKMPKSIPASTDTATTLAKTSSSDTYQVKSGDTLSAIARKEGIALSALRLENHLKNDRLKIGQVLTLPNVG
jgi:membrane-bound lytic murein transglycosylase D